VLSAHCRLGFAIAPAPLIGCVDQPSCTGKLIPPNYSKNGCMLINSSLSGTRTDPLVSPACRLETPRCLRVELFCARHGQAHFCARYQSLSSFVTSSPCTRVHLRVINLIVAFFSNAACGLACLMIFIFLPNGLHATHAAK
jgi:hypothetical protein